MKNVLKTVAKAYMISGDMNGYNGIKKIKTEKCIKRQMMIDIELLKIGQI